ncbi:wall-associated receptor kinase 2-like [Miscanthus floridulus]|uniref:wall-associated receptor kinase 2-like n=1 Tax=Miscanthus floridulus TaxID=154761 RepID=UPI003458178B
MALAFAAAAVALMAMALQLSAAAATAPIGQPGCNTTCGDVSVPYPFGYGPSRCYWPGLNLTCDTSHQSPRLLLGDGTRVTAIFLGNSTVRVVRTDPIIINTTGNLFTSDGWNASLDFGRDFREHGYLLSAENELVVFGCNVVATLSADIVGEETTKIVSGCASCTKSDRDDHIIDNHSVRLYCTGTLRPCCVASLTSGGVPKAVQARWLYSGNHTLEQTLEPVTVLVTPRGWIDDWAQWVDGFKEVSLFLDFGVKQDLPEKRSSVVDYDCPQDVHRMVCKSEHSSCSAMDQGYTCSCDDGYDGNPYLVGGCQDVDECKLLGEDRVCFGVCTNTIGSYYCWCPQGTYGKPDVQGGCVDYNFNKDALSPTVATVPTGTPGCNTTCGDVHVPYPFGFGPSRCYWPRFNLTCDTSHNPPRLLLHDNSTDDSLQVVHISLRNSTVHVVHISLRNSTVHVVHHGSIGVMDPLFFYRLVDFPLPYIGEPYALSTRNEFIVLSGSGVRATLYGQYRNGSSSNSNSNIGDDSIISRAVCSPVGDRGADGYCTGHDGCCHAPIPAGSTPKRVEFKALNGNNGNYHHYGSWPWYDALAFISEMGLTDQWHKIFNMGSETIGNMSSPIVLQWAVKQGLSVPAADNSRKCAGDVASRLCMSEHSDCRQENGGFTCHCSKGYDGNPYVADGCQDIDDCNIPALRQSCLGGYCNNLPGHYECRSPTGLIIGLSVASGPALLLLVMGILFLLRKLKQRRTKLLKQKYFKQNRGLLLQQLLFQKADIAEKMIIPLDELAKATNNFDKARELGGGGHGTVYKGILSDLHVVAIKKSKITVQKEIDEFINEVAILSQINHKNVVKLFGCCLETEVPLLVYEFISNGTLYHHLHVEEPRSLSWGSRLRIATEIAAALAYLHSSDSIPIIHRDIKSSNILLDDTMTSKISDFGASRYIPVDKTGLTTRVQGTIGYLDPMYFYTNRLTEKSDVYSFGVILVELLTRKKPFLYLSSEGDGLASHFVNLLSEGNLSQIIDPQVMEEGGTEVQEVATLAALCINLRGEERPTMRQVEHTLHGLMTDNPSLSGQGQRCENPCSRRYSLEQEMASYPR